MRITAVAFALALAMPAFADDWAGQGIGRADVIARDLAVARQREAAVDYAGGLRILDQTIARGGAEPTQYVELHLIAGRLAAGLDRPGEAEAHFARVLALRPDTRLPDGTSPKLTAPFEAARARSVTLAITVSNDRGLVRITPAADPLGLVAGISVHVVSPAGEHRDVVDRRALRITVPAGSTVLEVIALDADGHHIWVSPHAPAATHEPTVAALSTDPMGFAPAWYARWKTWAAVGGVSLVVGGVAAWRFSVAQDDFDAARDDETTSYSDLRDIEDRGQTWGLTASIALGVAAASAIASVVLFATVDEGPPQVFYNPATQTVGWATRF